MAIDRKSRLYQTLKWAYQPLKATGSVIRDLTYGPKRSALVKQYHHSDFAGLHIGCGPFHMTGWMNTDLPPNSHMDFPLDISRPLPFPDNYFHAIYGAEVIEHIPLAEGRLFFQEARRILRPGGVLRLTTPDLENICRIFLHQNPQADPAKFGTVWIDGEFSDEIWINAMFHFWGHQFLYNFAALERELETAEFTGIIRCQPLESQSAYAQLQGLETRYGENAPAWRFEHVLVVEATKPDSIN